MSKRWRFRLLCATAIFLTAWGFDRFQSMHWVGGTDLEIEFAVTDAATGQPIAGTELDIYSEGGFYKEHDEKNFKLSVDENGIARRICHDSMCFGTASGLRFTDTYVVHLPQWHFRLSAPGYKPSGLIFLDVPENAKRVQRIDPGTAKLVIPVSLQKS